MSYSRTEQLDSLTIHSRLWPRSAALAERLWSDPQEDWTQAQYRMNNHRERLVRMNVQAELLQPAWCYQNDGFCGTGTGKEAETETERGAETKTETMA